MKYHSTRNGNFKISLSHALKEGLAQDGGLFLPEKFPAIDYKNFNGKTLADFSAQLLETYFTEDILSSELNKITQNAFNFPIQITELDNHVQLLELFHGPTAAFKDFGARFLAESLSRIVQKESSQDLCILVATSGDTGGAVASAFHNKKGIKVKILFPKNKISPLQEKQLTCWDNNIESYRVDGSFDDCQKMVKDAFQNISLKKEHNLSSANSINIGRLLPQMCYHAWSAIKFFEAQKEKVHIVVPSGNLGNVFGAFWARRIGFPIDSITLATNANKTVVDFYQSGEFHPQKSVSTLANAMDVGNPSNLERLNFLYPDWKELVKNSQAHSVSDSQILQEMKEVYESSKAFICPHTAVGTFVARHQLTQKKCLVSATAHPAKFQEVSEKALNKKPEMPETLKELLSRTTKVKDIGTQYQELF